MIKPFDEYIEGLELANNQGDWIPVELFLASVRGYRDLLLWLLAPPAQWKFK
jgi:hypothetical protein